MIFALGKIADDAKSRIGKQAEQTVTQYMQNNRNVIAAGTPLIQHVQLERMLDNHELCAKKIAEQAEAAASGEGQKAGVFAELRRSPICNPPVRAINPVTLAPKLELCFYMASILESDELIDWPSQGMSPYGGIATAMNAKSRPINAMPSSAAYPKPAPARMSGFVVPGHQSIGITRVGSSIRSRVDEVCHIVRKKPFYGRNSESGSSNDLGKRDELLAAERIMKALLDETRPQAMLDQKL